MESDIALCSCKECPLINKCKRFTSDISKADSYIQQMCFQRRFYMYIDDKPFYLYHVTSPEYGSNILKIGLGGNASGMMYFSQHPFAWIWMFKEWVILRVNLTGFLLTTTGDSGIDEQIAWTGYIEPNRISLYAEGESGDCLDDRMDRNFRED